MSITKGSLCCLKDINNTYDNLNIPVRWPLWGMDDKIKNVPKIIDYLSSKDVFVLLDIETMKNFEHNYTIIVLTSKGVVGTMGISKDELFLAINKG